MKFVFARIDQNAVAVYVTLVVDWFIRLATVVERDGIGPHVLLSLANFLAVVSPVYAVPVKIIVDAVFETRPHRGARIGGRSVDDDRARSGTAAVIDPVFVTALTFLVRARDVITERACVPDIDRAVELLDVVLRYERG